MVEEQICQLVCLGSLEFRGSMTFSTVSGSILWFCKEELSVLMLKSSFSKSASAVWKELLKEGDPWKPVL